VGKKAPLSVNIGQNGFLSQAGSFGEEKISYLCREWNFDTPVVHLLYCASCLRSRYIEINKLNVKYL
jgi:hypothetical protein